MFLQIVNAPNSQVLECGEEKVLTLTEVECIKALAAQLVKLLRAQRNSSLPVTQLLSGYSKTFGYGLHLQDYDVSSLPALLAKRCHVVKVESSGTFLHLSLSAFNKHVFNNVQQMFTVYCVSNALSG